MVIKGYQIGPLARSTGKEILADNVLGLAAQTAYYFFFSLFPLFLFLAPLLGVVGDERKTFSFLLAKLARSVPADAFRLVAGVVRDVVFSPNAPGMMSVGALLAIWSGSNIFSALMGALNTAYDVKESRPWWKQKLIAVGAVLVAGVGLIVATTVLIGGEDVVGAVAGWVGLGERSKIIWTVLQFPIAFVVLIATAWGLFFFLPNLRISRSHALVAAIVTTVLWLVVTLIFRFYVQNFGSYDKTYGTMGGIIVLLTWMYLSMLVMISGGELASELHKGTGAIVARKGAVLNGRIAAGATPRASTDRVGRVSPMAAKGKDGE